MTTTEPAPDDRERFVTDDNGFVQIQHEGIEGRPFVHPDAFTQHYEPHDWIRVEREPAEPPAETPPAEVAATKPTRRTGAEKQES